MGSRREKVKGSEDPDLNGDERKRSKTGGAERQWTRWGEEHEGSKGPAPILSLVPFYPLLSSSSVLSHPSFSLLYSLLPILSCIRLSPLSLSLLFSYPTFPYFAPFRGPFPVFTFPLVLSFSHFHPLLPILPPNTRECAHARGALGFAFFGVRTSASPERDPTGPLFKRDHSIPVSPSLRAFLMSYKENCYNKSRWERKKEERCIKKKEYVYILRIYTKKEQKKTIAPAEGWRVNSLRSFGRFFNSGRVGSVSGVAQRSMYVLVFFVSLRAKSIHRTVQKNLNLCFF